MSLNEVSSLTGADQPGDAFSEEEIKNAREIYEEMKKNATPVIYIDEA
ncbi:hypothetical protein VIBNISFn118_730001 [Vibrio nigripulchritudo SFn118]|nr:hypothetical protein VIBNISFn118_730001 [Vibrio nigripulchritudo SFn118]